ncbi:MAG: AAA family ATPase [Nitrospirae bacterium]|nr:AAA family ATPase [Nitrospirota bacterium]
MYEDYFNLRESPFNQTPDPRFFFLSPQHEEALSYLLYGIREKKGFVAITGEIGTGKTTLCRLLLERLDAKVRSAILFNPCLSTVELLQAVNLDFGLPGRSASRLELVDELNRFLLKVSAEGGNAVLVLDEAQSLSTQALEQVRLLSNLETDREKLLQIVLVGQLELRQKLDLPELRQLNQRIALRYALTPLDEAGTAAYIAHRIRVAGGGDQVFFTSQATGEVHRYSSGVPRLINLVCDKALLGAFARSHPAVSQEIVQQAIAELQWHALAPLGGESEVRGPRSEVRGPKSEVRGPKSEVRTMGWAVAGFGLLALGVLAGSYLSSSPPALQPSSHQSLAQPQGLRVEGEAFRTDRPVEGPVAAALSLLRLWQVDTRRLEKMTAFIATRAPSSEEAWWWGREFGLQVLEIPLRLPLLRAMDYPCLITGFAEEGEPPRPVVLVALDEQEAEIFDPLRGRLVYPLERVLASWGERGIVWWRGLEGLRLPLDLTRPNADVMRLQTVLARQGLYQGKLDGRFGPQTEAALAAFQRRSGLEGTGRLDEVTLAVLSRLEDGGDNLPRLSRAGLPPDVHRGGGEAGKG